MMRQTRSAPLRLAVTAACTALLGACVSATPVREAAPGTTPTAGSDEAELWYAMERAERELQRSPLLVRDPALNAYVRNVACSVAAEYCKDLRLYIVDVPQFNASMAPNGVMLVWTGALLRMRDEAELAFVLGHETGHFTAQHSLRQWRRIKDTSAWLSAFQILAYGYGAPNTAMLGGLAGYATLFKYTRDMEREADRLGFASTVARGYDPQAGVALWSRMLAEEETRRYERQAAVFSSHPATLERLNDIRAAAAAQPEAPRNRQRDAYRTATRPFLEHWLDADLGQRRYAGSLLLINGLLADAPTTDRGVLTFYLGEAHRRRNAKGDRAKAAELYAQAVALPGAPAAAWREHGFALRDAANPAAARDALQRYLRDAPNAEDRAFVQRELTRLGGTQ
jgi:predicted Zn-dependent protease